MPKTRRHACSGLIFDLDGVLINSDPVSERHWRDWAKRNDVSFDHILSIHHGRPAAQTISIVAPHLDADKEAEYFENHLTEDVDGLLVFAGAAALLGLIPPHRWAIATSAPGRMATARLAHLGLPIPPVLVSANDVAVGKPDPEPYLIAAERLGLPATQCAVVEDAPAGITSAKTAGAHVIAVATSHGRDALREAHAIVDELIEIDARVTAKEILLSWGGDPDRL